MVEIDSRQTMSTIIPPRQVLGASSLPINKGQNNKLFVIIIKTSPANQT